MAMPLLTEVKKQRQARHEKIRKYHKVLSADESKSKTAIEQKIMKKFGIKARSTVWKILKG